MEQSAHLPGSPLRLSIKEFLRLSPSSFVEGESHKEDGEAY